MEKRLGQQGARAFAASGVVPRSPAKPRFAVSFAVRLLLPVLCFTTLGSSAVLPVRLVLGALERGGLTGAAVLAVPAVHLFAISVIAVTVGFKWLLIGKLRPGLYEIHSLMFIRWWALDHALGILRRIVLKPVYGCAPAVLRLVARSLGATVGAGSGAADLINGGVDLMRVGEGVGFNGEAHAALVVDGMLILAPVALGAYSQVGDLTMIGPGTVVGSGTLIAPGSALGAGCQVPPEVRVSGVPAQITSQAPPRRSAPPPPPSRALAAVVFAGLLAPAFYVARYAVLASTYQALLRAEFATHLAYATPSALLNNYFMYQISHWSSTAFGWAVVRLTSPILTSPITHPSHTCSVVRVCALPRCTHATLVACDQVIVAKWTLLGRLYDGQLLTPSLAFRRWMVDTLLHLHLDAPFFCRGATNTGAIMPTVMRLLGQAVHPGCERCNCCCHLTPRRSLTQTLALRRRGQLPILHPSRV